MTAVIKSRSTVRLNKFFSRHPVFTVGELADFLAEWGSENQWTRKALLAHHLKQGHIMRIRRGLYVVVPLGVDPKNCPVDPYLLAAKMTDDAVLAYHTALEFHGRAYSVYERFLYLTGRVLRPMTFRSYHFRGVLIPKTLRDKSKQAFGITVGERAGVNVRVTSLERTLVDLLDRPDLGGSWEEIWRSLESVEFFDLDQVVEYALLLGNATTVAKVGFFLEQHREPLMVDDVHLQPLREHRPRSPHYLVRNSERSGHLVTGWNLIVPAEILERSWAEVP
jgi:predicted transcriptional regulator of viral defense system